MSSFCPLRSILHYSLDLRPEANLCGFHPCPLVSLLVRPVGGGEKRCEKAGMGGQEVLPVLFLKFTTGWLCPLTGGQLQAALFLCYFLQFLVITLSTCPFKPWVVTLSAVANLGVLHLSFLCFHKPCLHILFSLFNTIFRSPSLSMLSFFLPGPSLKVVPLNKTGNMDRGASLKKNIINAIFLPTSTVIQFLV